MDFIWLQRAFYLVLQFKKHKLFLAEKYARVVANIFQKHFHIDLYQQGLLKLNSTPLTFQLIGFQKNAFGHSSIRCRFAIRIRSPADNIYNYIRFLKKDRNEQNNTTATSRTSTPEIPRKKRAIQDTFATPKKSTASKNTFKNLKGNNNNNNNIGSYVQNREEYNLPEDLDETNERFVDDDDFEDVGNTQIDDDDDDDIDGPGNFSLTKDTESDVIDLKQTQLV